MPASGHSNGSGKNTGRKNTSRNNQRKRRRGNSPTPNSQSANKILTAGDFLGLARVVGFAAAILVAIALGLGSYNDIVSSDGPANFILPFAIAIVVAGGLGAGWHVVFAMAAQANTIQAKSIAFAIGIGLMIIGMGTSAWFLASKIGGSTAIQTHQTLYLVEFKEAEKLISQNFAKESVILQLAKLGASKLEADALGEGKHGTFSGKSGFKGVYISLKNAAESLLGVQGGLKKLENKRRRLMNGVRREVDEAARAISERDGSMFRKSVSRAAALLADADSIRLSSAVAGMSLGSAPGDAGNAILTTQSGIGDKADEIEAELLAVSIPIYVPMDAKTAVTTYPAPLPWLMAILLEGLPLLMLGLLLALPPMDSTNRRST